MARGWLNCLLMTHTCDNEDEHGEEVGEHEVDDSKLKLPGVNLKLADVCTGI